MNLLKVQDEALKHSFKKPGYAYFMEMGLGKTLLALTEFDRLVQEREATRLVVVCPNSFKTGWLDEIRKHGLKVHPHIFASGADYENGQFLKVKFTRPPVLIINYEAIRKTKVQEYIRQFVEGRNAMLVLDESIQIKTYKSLQSKAAILISGMFKFKRVLSGKPITQGPHDLWAQMRAIGAIYDKYYAFRATFCRMGGWQGKVVVGAQNEQLLAAKIDKYIFRASKADWLDLPPKTYTTRHYELTDVLKRRYKEMEDNFVTWLNEDTNVTVDAFITKYIKLAQIQSGFIIDEHEVVHELEPQEYNPRFNAVVEVLDELDSKAVVVYVHRHSLNILQHKLQNWNPAHIKGNMEPIEIQEQKDKFNNNSSCRVILVQMRAGKYGHTLLGGTAPKDKCHTTIFAENSYSLDDRSQIEDRIHRHGQTVGCLYVDLWGTELDHRIVKALQNKESIAQAAFRYFGIQRSK